MRCYSYLMPLLSVIAPASSIMYSLSLHDALPISRDLGSKFTEPQYLKWVKEKRKEGKYYPNPSTIRKRFGKYLPSFLFRSEEHTSELQSRGHLVCRLLLEKKHQIYTMMISMTLLI